MPKEIEKMGLRDNFKRATPSRLFFVKPNTAPSVKVKRMRPNSHKSNEEEQNSKLDVEANQERSVNLKFSKIIVESTISKEQINNAIDIVAAMFFKLNSPSLLSSRYRSILYMYIIKFPINNFFLSV